jgi:hypothetical protein
VNLHNIASAYVTAVNPLIAATLLPSTGYTKDPNTYKQVPSYGSPQTVMVQIQALQYNDIQQLDGMNIQGERRAVYLNGDWNGVVRADKIGGDLLKFADHPGGPERTWLVALVAENWPDWTKVLVTLQVDEHA